MGTRETDVVRHLLVVDPHDDLLLFSNRGKVYRLKCYEIPQDLSRTTKGTAVVNLLSIDPKDRITALVVAQDANPDLFMVMATSRGIVKKTRFDAFASVRSSGLVAMKLRAEEELITAGASERPSLNLLIGRERETLAPKVVRLLELLNAVYQKSGSD